MGKYKKFVYIDDSGDPGFKSGSSRFFVIVCVKFDSDDEMRRAKRSLTEFKQRLGWGVGREFKFRRANDKLKEEFFKEISQYRFIAKAILVDKSKIKEAFGDFYHTIIIETLLLLGDLNDSRIVLDGNSGRVARKKLASDVRRTLKNNGSRVVKFDLMDSKDEVLVQMADMIAGAIVAKNDMSKRYKSDYLKRIGEWVEVVKYKN